MPPGSLSKAAGDIIMPARSDSCDSSEASGSGQAQHHGLGVRRLDAGDRGQLALAVAVGQRARTFQIGLTAAASTGAPSWNTASLRSLKVSVLLSSLVVHDCASCGTIFRSGVMSTSLSHSDAKTMRPTKVRARTGSSTSGSSAGRYEGWTGLAPIRWTSWPPGPPRGKVYASRISVVSYTGRPPAVPAFRSGLCRQPEATPRRQAHPRRARAWRILRHARGACIAWRARMAWADTAARRTQGRRQGAEKSAARRTASRICVISARASSRRN